MLGEMGDQMQGDALEMNALAAPRWHVHLSPPGQWALWVETSY